MELTKEQYDIIQSTGNIKINAVAGSGKTTTIIEYARTRPRSSRILYLAFNKSVKLEAAKKFAGHGLNNVQVETAHSLAYKHIVYAHQYKVRAQGYKTHEIAELLGLEANGEKHAEYIVANHINKFIAYFCNSDKTRVSALNYLEVVSDPKARSFVAALYPYIEKQTRMLLGKMDKGEIEVIHDFYLKKFQLSNPRLPYDYILFDEGQDASAAMLDVFLKQNATKVIVGDTHQQIYSWRYAINSLEKAAFKDYYLSASFRFPQDIANLAMEILQWKNILDLKPPHQITGRGTPSTGNTQAVIARTNLGLLLKAIAFTTENRDVKKIYFEGNIHSYTYAEEGASLYDVLHLNNHKRGLIKDKLIGQMKDLKELEEYIEKTEDVQLSMMVEMVKEYGNSLPEIIRTLKNKHLSNEEKEQAEIIFSTVHRSKGMEYDTVHLVNDFITEGSLEIQAQEIEGNPLLAGKLNEEINLLYVAITRARNVLHIPEQLMPEDFATSPHIKPLRVEDPTPAAPPVATRVNTPASANMRNATYKERAEKPKSAYNPWTEELDMELTSLFCKGWTLQEMATYFGRTKSAINARIKKLELVDLYG